MKNNMIKKGVEMYFRNKVEIENQSKQANQFKQINQFQQARKKVKKIDQPIIFEDDESFQL